MAGLLGGVLPYIYSQSDRLKRHLGGLLADPVGTAEQTAGGLLDSHRAQQGLLSQAFANKERPFQVTDEQAMMAAAQNMLNGPLGMAPAGMTKMVYPQDKALETARKNAVKMLGLPKNNTPMDRARALGFDIDAYRGSSANEKIAKEAPFGAMGPAYYTANHPDAAIGYSSHQSGGNTMPLKLRGDFISNMEWSDLIGNHGWKGAKEQALKRGVSGVNDSMFEDAYAVFRPEVARSRFAAFDPARINDNDLLGRADPALLALLGLGGYFANDALKERK